MVNKPGRSSHSYKIVLLTSKIVGLNFRLRRYCVSTLGKLFTCLCQTHANLPPYGCDVNVTSRFLSPLAGDISMAIWLNWVTRVSSGLWPDYSSMWASNLRRCRRPKKETAGRLQLSDVLYNFYNNRRTGYRLGHQSTSRFLLTTVGYCKWRVAVGHVVTWNKLLMLSLGLQRWF